MYPSQKKKEYNVEGYHLVFSIVNICESNRDSICEGEILERFLSYFLSSILNLKKKIHNLKRHANV